MVVRPYPGLRPGVSLGGDTNPLNGVVVVPSLRRPGRRLYLGSGATLRRYRPDTDQ